MEQNVPQHSNSPDHLPNDHGSRGQSDDELMLALIGVAAMVAMLFAVVALKAAI